MASASIAQVHPAKLKSGEDVIVKVVRPDIKSKIIQDISLMKKLLNTWRACQTILKECT